jgi:hypothetical protein
MVEGYRTNRTRRKVEGGTALLSLSPGRSDVDPLGAGLHRGREHRVGDELKPEVVRQDSKALAGVGAPS